MKLQDQYALLDSGAAFGFGCGPLVVARKKNVSLRNARVAIPGIHTTACMLFQAWCSDPVELVPMQFDAILPAVQHGDVDAGIVIHEGRFVFERYDCHCLCDLGAWWEEKTELPVPLGCIATHREQVSASEHNCIEKIIRESLLYARQYPEASRAYIRSLAGELDDAVIDAHISLYVNDYSLSLGDKGRAVMKTLEELLS
jgi:1,4-dihydroxy-6-naphthoate synthase